MSKVHFEEWLPLRGVWLHTLGVFARYFLVPAILVYLFCEMMPRSHFGVPTGHVGTEKTQIANFKTALELYRVDHGGKVPTTRQGLRTLIRTPHNSDPLWKGPYLNDVSQVPLDSWNNPYVYQSPGPHGEPYLITSYGADGKPGGEGFNEDLQSAKR